MQNNADTCIHCGTVIPEGRWVCKDCESKGREKDDSEIHMPKLRGELLRAGSTGTKSKILSRLFRNRNRGT